MFLHTIPCHCKGMTWGPVGISAALNGRLPTEAHVHREAPRATLNKNPPNPLKSFYSETSSALATETVW